ncbi:zinc ribbon domain-containing protein [Lacticaseibacillus nasuensis]|uniref:zinc ribbon domain-containing protein n=1 Tax=Lacticaseibacillus nasuensis TaxID=944671 RepID=UPI00224830CC|nr:zinc ribbon domain-containing protein [Lacticaseibacillus nasuensis]MCX2456154.1 zinc ribbon domain-containing protein [Lacticaseibacillus nasuensis]
MKYCPNCGAELVPGAKFCANCGAIVGAVTAPAQPAPTTQPSQPQPAATPTQPQAPQPPTAVLPTPPTGVAPVPAAPRRRGKKMWWLLAAAVVVLAAGAGWWYTHQLYNLGHTRFRQSTVYAFTNNKQDSAVGVSARTAKDSRAYFQFNPNGSVNVSVLYREDSTHVVAWVTAGTYRLQNGRVLATMRDTGYGAQGKTYSKLFTEQLKKSNTGKQGGEKGVYNLTLSGKYATTLSFTLPHAAKAQHIKVKAPSPAVPGKQAAFDAAALMARIQAARK